MAALDGTIGWFQRAERMLTSRAGLVVLGVVAFTFLLFLGSHLTFFNDEWWFIAGRQEWTLASFMAPHNGHWVLTTAAVWKPLMEIVGLRSYLPYLAADLVAHLLVAAAVQRIATRQAGPRIGLLSAVLILFFGRAHEVILQSFAFNLVAATAAGTWALALVLENGSRRSFVVAAVLLVVSVASAGVGLFFIASIAVTLLFLPGGRHRWWVVVPAVIAYGAWFATDGRTILSGSGAVAGTGLLDLIVTLVAFGVAGIGSSVGAVLGAGTALGLVATVGLVLVVGGDLLRRRRLPAGVVAGVVGLFAELAITGVARAGLGAEQATAPRYAYMGGVFVLVAGTAWLGDRLRMTGGPRWLLPAAVAGMCVAIALNTAGLIVKSEWWSARADATRAVVTAFLEHGGRPAMPDDRRAPRLADDPWVDAVPPPAALRELVRRYGSPLDDVLVPGVPAIPAAVRDLVLASIVRPAITVTQDVPRPAAPIPVEVVSTRSVTLDPADGCLRVQPDGAGPELVLGSVAGGAMVWLEGAGSPEGPGLTLSAHGTWPAATRLVVPLEPARPAAVAIPDLGPEVRWSVRLDGLAHETLLCLE